MNKGALEDRHCQNDVESLVKKHNIKRIIETGSFKGWSTKILATFCDKVDTIEINSEYIAEAVEHLKETNNVTIHKGSSPDVMKNIISYDEKNLLVFLDAHWEDYWPVNDELKVLYEKNVQPVICIHDFFVPGGDLIKDYSDGNIIIEDSKEIKKEPKEEIVEDVLQILNVYTAKMNGLRKYKS